jgi:tetratricopeptide (TPR) repeat protein
LWEAAPLTPQRRLQREAAALVNDLPTNLGFKDEILDYLRTLPALSEPLREHALNMAARLQEDPWRLNHASHEAVRPPGRNAAQYRLALRQAEAARDLAHPGFYFTGDFHATTNIGIAHYRLGEYREAVEALTASEAYYAAASSRYQAGAPWNLAFLVMARHQLGEKDTAQSLLARLHTVMKGESAWAASGELQAYLREAEDLSWWGAPPLTEEKRRLWREAAALVNDPPADLGFKDEILDYLRTLPALSAPLRELALTIAERLPEDPWRLNRASAQIVARPDLDAAKYQRALRQAEAAQRLGPPGEKFPRTTRFRPEAEAGIAHYRLGQYRECVETLLRADAIYTEHDKRGSGARLLSYLAMAYYQLGQKDEARNTLARLRAVMKDPAWPNTSPTYVRQAEALIEGKAPVPQK